MKVVINQSGCISFSSKSPVQALIVKDLNGEIIYCRKFTPAVFKFDINFPVGGSYDFITNSDSIIFVSKISPLYIPEIPELPVTNHTNVKVSGKIIKRSGNSGSPVSINLKCGDIITNERFDRFPKYAKDFCLAHEEGHLKYHSEEDCDYYALRKIVMSGGNIMPCFYTLNMVLSRNINNNIRITEFISTIKKIT